MLKPKTDESPSSSTGYEQSSELPSTSAAIDPVLPTEQPSKEQRVPLACLRCRAKRARCSGVRPRCKACETADVECQWPEGRRRKRTRREMEEAERRERKAVAAATIERVRVGVGPIPQQVPPVQLQQQNIHRLASWDFGSHVGHETPMPMARHVPQDKQWEYSMSPVNPSYIWPPQGPSASSLTAATGPSPALEESALDALANASMVPGSSEQLLRAVQSQTAFVEGDPDANEDLELYYYRFAGSTAIHPGINRISLKLQPRPPLPASAPVPGDQRLAPTSPWPDELFDENSMPIPSVHRSLLDLFFTTMSQHFPSISRRRMDERLETGTMSAFFLNCICAVAARFYTESEGRAVEACAPFITKAQELIVPLLHLPAHDSVTGLLLLAWASYGQNSEAALWQYSGMAFRMSFDLGLHEVSDIYESRGHVVRSRLLFWSLFVTDRIISFATGRPVSIPEEVIEIPLPTDEDFFPDPARNTDSTSNNEQVEPVPFQYLVRALVLCGRISSALNGQRGRQRTLAGMSETGPQVLSGLQTQLVQFYANLPESMKWSVENFKHQEARGHGGTFVTLHLWTNAVMTLVYHPELTVNPPGTHITQSMQRSMRLSLSSSRNISECLVFTDLFSSRAYLGSPFSVQPIFVACLAFIYEMRRNVLLQSSDTYSPLSPASNEPPSAGEFMTSIARQNMSVLTTVLERMEQYWAGIAYVLSVLEQRAAGLGYPRTDSDAKTVKTFISLPDKGLLRRYTGKNLPHNTAPASETSLRTSIENDEKEQTDGSSFYVAELLRSYRVGDPMVEPASDYDLQRLLADGPFLDRGNFLSSSLNMQ